MFQLCLNTSGMGYGPTAQYLEQLLKAFPSLAASSITKFRQKVSFTFFKNIFTSHLKDQWSTLPTYQGLQLIGIDGDEYVLPTNEDVLSQGFRGRAVKGGTETYYPRMYVVKAVHLLSGLVCGFYQSHLNNEIVGAQDLLKGLPEKIVAVYDRFYFCRDLIKSHIEHGSYFICRCKVGSTFSEVIRFVESPRRAQDVVIEGVVIRLIKIKNPKTQEDLVFATNLPKQDWGRKKIEEIYRLRWDCETTNRDQQQSLKMENFHAKSINGILQEIYCSLTLFNFLRMEAFMNGGYLVSPDTKRTCKTNFKFLVDSSALWLGYFWKNQMKKVFAVLERFIKTNLAKRTRMSRQYERTSKSASKHYKNSSLIKRREP